MPGSGGHPERTDVLLLKLLVGAGLPPPDEVLSSLGGDRLTVLWHEQRTALVVERDGEGVSPELSAPPARHRRPARD